MDTDNNQSLDNKILELFKSKVIDWHTGFNAALQLDFDEIKDQLKFYTEVKLPVGHFLIDLLIIKKIKKVKLPPELANNPILLGLFDNTVVEFKSGEESFNLADLYKILSITYIFAICEGIPFDKIAVMVVSLRFPRELFKALRGYLKVKKESSGIFAVKGGHILIRVVVPKMLPAGINKWLVSLRKNLSAEQLMGILSEAKRFTGNNNFAIFIDVIANANKNIIKKGDTKMSTVLFDIFREKGLLDPITEQRFVNVECETKADDIIRILTDRFKTPSKKLQKQLKDVKNADKLNELLLFAINCVSIDEFATAFNS
ncbi:MAG: hypothetical protein LBT09_00570 [Planctomycetaceae bacterium]|jgi:hypothetical protein|nr:hypothetical protein [Planctomycetaceae bacterium]